MDGACDTFTCAATITTRCTTPLPNGGCAADFCDCSNGRALPLLLAHSNGRSVIIRRRDFGRSRLADFASSRSPIGPQLLNRPYPLTLSLRSAFSVDRASHRSRLFQRFQCNAGPDTVNPSNAYVDGCINGTQIYMQQHAAVMGGAGIAVACLMVRSVILYSNLKEKPRGDERFSVQSTVFRS